LLFALSRPVDAQQPAKITRIGYLAAGFAPAAAGRVEAFRNGLRSLGYIEGKNVLIEYRNAAGKIDQVPQNAAELVRLPVDIIVTAGPIDTKAAKQATKTIPIVMSQDTIQSGTALSPVWRDRAVTSPAYPICRLNLAESA
jgi:putative ABC transport system substrate-binding protein